MIRLSDIAGESIILYPRSAGASLYDEVVTTCSEAGFSPRLEFEVPQTASAVTLVAANLGVSIVPAPIARVQLKGVVYVGIDGNPTIARLALASPKAVRSPILDNLFSLI